MARMMNELSRDGSRQPAQPFRVLGGLFGADSAPAYTFGVLLMISLGVTRQRQTQERSDRTKMGPQRFLPVGVLFIDLAASCA